MIKNEISSSGITGVESHGKHTRATEHGKKLGNKIAISAWGAIFGPKFFFSQFFHMLGDDSVYAYHDFATRKNVVMCPLPGS